MAKFSGLATYSIALMVTLSLIHMFMLSAGPGRLLSLPMLLNGLQRHFRSIVPSLFTSAPQEGYINFGGSPLSDQETQTRRG